MSFAMMLNKRCLSFHIRAQTGHHATLTALQTRLHAYRRLEAGPCAGRSAAISSGGRPANGPELQAMNRYRYGEDLKRKVLLSDDAGLEAYNESMLASPWMYPVESTLRSLSVAMPIPAQRLRLDDRLAQR